MKLFDLLNVAMTLPVVFLALMMLRHWFPRALGVLRKGAARSGEDWLILGVAVGFSGFVLNALFWGYHFLVTLMQWPGMIDLTYKLGPVVNVFTRHIPYGLSAAFHIVAFWTYNKGSQNHPRWFFILSVAWVAIFYFVLKAIAP